MKNNIVVLLISGHAGSGKDLFAQYVKKYLTQSNPERSDILITHFADFVKFICEKFLDWDGEKDYIGRILLQYVGTDIFRSIDPNYWVNFIIEMTEVFRNKWRYIIIPDARFPNEIDRMKEEFGKIIHVRVQRQIIEDDLPDYLYRHVSETALDNYPYDYLIENDGDKSSLETLALNIADVMERLYDYEQGGIKVDRKNDERLVLSGQG